MTAELHDFFAMCKKKKGIYSLMHKNEENCLDSLQTHSKIASKYLNLSSYSYHGCNGYNVEFATGFLSIYPFRLGFNRTRMKLRLVLNVQFSTIVMTSNLSCENKLFAFNISKHEFNTHIFPVSNLGHT